MIISTDAGACLVAVPRTGSLSLQHHLETSLRPDRNLYNAERLHHWHANLAEVELTQELPFSVYDLWSCAVVRNPFDRLISYCARVDEEFHTNPREVLRRRLTESLDGVEDRWMLPQNYFTAGVKQIYRFESLQDAVIDINRHFGINSNIPLPVENSSRHERYPVYFDSELKHLTELLYADDLKTFGYHF